MISVGYKANAFTYSSLIRGFFQVGKSDKAILLWKEMAEKDCKDNEVCYSVLIHGLCKDGKLKDALMIWKHVLAKGLTPDTVAYSSMIHGLCNAGLIEQGLDLFNEMLYRLLSPVIRQLTEKYPHVTTYKIDINKGGLENALSKLNIHSVPTLHFFQDGEKASEVIGADVQRLKDTMEALYK
ncbi:Thioredoxin O1, mitochondrial [Sesamum angolense]|uniref:Thioredoxin O1, mitochondrial n=1 Tax=Sesamum angolense TaxID=2727404 RepID=A0AAE2BI96_9LAMI|nr:Thioredoxin O1, mitochondrial [Sesamum angolense]